MNTTRGAVALVVAALAGIRASGAAAETPVEVSPRLLVQSDAIAYAGGEADPEVGDQVERSGFRLRRARAGLDVAAGWWRARALLELHADGDVGGAGGPGAGASGSGLAPGRLRLTEAFVRLGRHKAFHADAGSLRVPFSLSRQVDEGDLRLPERPAAVDGMAPDFRLGAAVGGDLGLIQYAGGLFNADETGAGGQVVGRGILCVARLSAEPVGPMGVSPWMRPSADPWWSWWRFSVGASAFVQEMANGRNYGVEGDAQLQWRRLTVTAEVLWVRRWPQRLGFALEPGVFVWRDRLETIVRVEWFDHGYGYPSPTDAWALTAGLNYITWGRRVRLQAAYSHRRERYEPRSNDWAIARATFAM